MEDKPRTDSLLIYLEDNGKLEMAYGHLVEINIAYVKFETSTNILIIPIVRILKIKMKRDN